MDLPSLRQLECLVAAAEHKSFSAAARACFITQPSLSAQIQQLEARLGVELFERRGRRVLLTSVGRELVAAARRVVADARAFVDVAESCKEPLGGILRLGVIPTVAPYLLPAALARLHARYPKLGVQVVESPTARLVAELDAGELDVVLVALEAELGNAETTALFEDVFELLAPADHALARKKRVGLEDLADQVVLLLDHEHCLRDQTLSLCQEARARTTDDFRATSLATLVEMVRSGIGVTLLPRLAATTELRGDRGLALVPFRSSPARTIGLAWRRGSPRRRDYELLAGVLRELGPPAPG
jgi:LysR family hydrogen peroxide-inducible transcriptional activator